MSICLISINLSQLRDSCNVFQSYSRKERNFYFLVARAIFPMQIRVSLVLGKFDSTLWTFLKLFRKWCRDDDVQISTEAFRFPWKEEAGDCPRSISRRGQRFLGNASAEKRPAVSRADISVQQSPGWLNTRSWLAWPAIKASRHRRVYEASRFSRNGPREKNYFALFSHSLSLFTFLSLSLRATLRRRIERKHNRRYHPLPIDSSVRLTYCSRRFSSSTTMLMQNCTAQFLQKFHWNVTGSYRCENCPWKLAKDDLIADQFLATLSDLCGTRSRCYRKWRKF